MKMTIALLFMILSWSEAQAQKTDFEQALFLQLQDNLQSPNLDNPFYHVIPAPKFSGTYLWDSAFIALVWNVFEPNIAEQVIQSVLVHQDSKGRIPLVHNIFGNSSLIQPPLLSWAALKISTRKDFLQKIYPGLSHFHHWIQTHRQNQLGLYFWRHPYESGVDNSPRFSNRDESSMSDTRQMSAIDLSSYMVKDAQSLSTMAEILGDEGAAQGYKQEALQLSERIQTLLWDPSQRHFVDLWANGEFSPVISIASELPLWAGVGTDEQIRQMQNDLMDPEQFQTQIPFPSVARNSKYFEKDCWRGPVWVNLGFLMIEGLRNSGQIDAAESSSAKLVHGVQATWELRHEFVEFYDPDQPSLAHLTRKKATGLWGIFSGSWDLWTNLQFIFGKELYLGERPVNHFVGWTGLVEVLIQSKAAVE